MKRVLAIAFATLMGLPSLAHAAGSASGTFTLHAYVPVSCWVQPQNGPVQAQGGENAAGTVLEACNNPGGFRVMASYRPLEADESAVFTYAGRAIDLPHTGDALLRTSNMAQINTVSYSFQSTTLDQPLVMALAIEPL